MTSHDQRRIRCRWACAEELVEAVGGHATGDTWRPRCPSGRHQERLGHRGDRPVQDHARRRRRPASPRRSRRRSPATSSALVVEDDADHRGVTRLRRGARENSTSSGCSREHGMHQVAKKLTTTHWPRWRSRSKGVPAERRRDRLAGEGRRDLADQRAVGRRGPARAPAWRARRSRATSTTTDGDRRYRARGPGAGAAWSTASTTSIRPLTGSGRVRPAAPRRAERPRSGRSGRRRRARARRPGRARRP